MTNEERGELIAEVRRDIHAELSGKMTLSRYTSVFAAIGVALNLGALVWKGGQWQAAMDRYSLDILAVTTRVTTLEGGATGQARSYMAATDEWKRATDSRIVRIEDALTKFITVQSTVQSDVAVIRSLLEQHNKVEKKL